MREYKGTEWTNERNLWAKESKTFSLHLHKNSGPGVKVFSEREGCCARAGVCHPQWETQSRHNGGRPIYSGARLSWCAFYLNLRDAFFVIVKWLPPNLQSPPHQSGFYLGSDWSVQSAQASDWLKNDFATWEADNMIKGPATFFRKIVPEV